MKSCDVVVRDEAGIHTRPAALLVKASNKFTSNVEVEYNGKKANLKSIMALVKLGIKGKSNITILADGEDEHQAVDTIVDLIKTNFR